MKEYDEGKENKKVLFFQKQHTTTPQKSNAESQFTNEESSSQEGQLVRFRQDSTEKMNIDKYMNEFCFQPVKSLKKQREDAKDLAEKLSSNMLTKASPSSKKSGTQSKVTAILTQNTMRLSTSDQKSVGNTNLWTKKTEPLSNQYTSDRSLGDYEVADDLKYEPKIELDQLNLFKMKNPKPRERIDESLDINRGGKSKNS